MESNHRLPPYKDDALTPELQPHKKRLFYIREPKELIGCKMEGWELCITHNVSGTDMSRAMNPFPTLYHR